MDEKRLLKAGLFAKLTHTTKRTLLWYKNKGIFNPTRISKSGYFLYTPQQIIDFQVLMLLRKLGFSITEIKSYLANNKSLENLFKLKQIEVSRKIMRLQKVLMDTKRYYSNMERFGVLVDPVIKNLKSFDIYYISRQGPYEKIYEYCIELTSYFKKITRDAVYLTIFEQPSFQPEKARMKIAIVDNGNLMLKRGVEKIVSKQKIPSFKALAYTYYGSPALLSLLWDEVQKYQVKKAIKINTRLPFNGIEFYHRSILGDLQDEEDTISEIFLPIQ